MTDEITMQLAGPIMPDPIAAQQKLAVAQTARKFGSLGNFSVTDNGGVPDLRGKISPRPGYYFWMQC